MKKSIKPGSFAVIKDPFGYVSDTPCIVIHEYPYDYLCWIFLGKDVIGNIHKKCVFPLTTKNVPQKIKDYYLDLKINVARLDRAIYLHKNKE